MGGTDDPQMHGILSSIEVVVYFALKWKKSLSDSLQPDDQLHSGTVVSGKFPSCKIMTSLCISKLVPVCTAYGGFKPHFALSKSAGSTPDLFVSFFLSPLPLVFPVGFSIC